MPRILLVDDDDDMRALLEDVLVEAGHEADTASTAASGCALVERRRYDLVIADGKLPDGTGMDVADRAMARGIKAIIITGYSFSVPDGDYEILHKPFSPVELLAAVKEATEGQAQDQSGSENLG